MSWIISRKKVVRFRRRVSPEGWRCQNRGGWEDVKVRLALARGTERLECSQRAQKNNLELQNFMTYRYFNTTVLHFVLNLGTMPWILRLLRPRPLLEHFGPVSSDQAQIDQLATPAANLEQGSKSVRTFFLVRHASRTIESKVTTAQSISHILGYPIVTVSR